MSLGLASYGLAFVAGVLSMLSPCVLPLIPIVFGSAIGVHRLGAFALASGLTISFTAAGLFVATVGYSLGLDAELFRNLAAVLLLILGAVLASASLQARFATATAAISTAGQSALDRLKPEGLFGQFLIGIVLGVAWSPCVGPTLGAAATLASQGKELTEVALAMTLFGLGAAVPMGLIGAASRTFTARWRGRFVLAGKFGKQTVGGVMAALGVLVLTGFDRSVEAFLVNASPAWLTDLTTRF